MDKLQLNGSDWTFDSCKSLNIEISEYQPFRGDSYIKTQSCIPKKPTINVNNNYSPYFMWVILSALFPLGHAKHSNRPSTYQQYVGTVNFNNIKFSIKNSDIPKFMKQNQNISINVFGWDKFLYPFYISDIFLENQINLIFICDIFNPFKYDYI